MESRAYQNAKHVEAYIRIFRATDFVKLVLTSAW